MNTSGKKIVAIDPNMDDLLFCYSPKNNKEHQNDDIFRWTKSQVNKETKKRKYNKKLVQDSKEIHLLNPFQSISQIESSLSQVRSVGSTVEEFITYLQAKIPISQRVRTFYEGLEGLHRKFRWKTYINTQRCNDKMLNNFAKTYGSPKDTIVCFGDCDQQNMRYLEPVKGKGLRRLFKHRGYKVLLVNEFRTSCRCSCCGSEMDKPLSRESHRPRTKGQILPVHGLLRCKTCNPSKGRLWNRDLNAAINIYNVAIWEFGGYGRPPHLSRS
jgi:hypothetical protein